MREMQAKAPHGTPRELRAPAHSGGGGSCGSVSRGHPSLGAVTGISPWLEDLRHAVKEDRLPSKGRGPGRQQIHTISFPPNPQQTAPVTCLPALVSPAQRYRDKQTGRPGSGRQKPAGQRGPGLEADTPSA